MKVQKLVATVVCASAWLLVAACGDRSMPTSPDSRFDSNGITVMHDGGTTSGASSSGSTSATTMNPAWTSSSSSSGGKVKETLPGPAINAVSTRCLTTAERQNISS